MDDNETFASFWGHMEEFRKTLLRILLVIGLSLAICFVFYQPLISFFKKPLNPSSTDSFHEERLEYLRLTPSGSATKTVTLPENSLVFNELSKDALLLGGSTYQIFPGGSLVYAKMVSKEQELVFLGPLEGILISLKTSLWTGAFLSSPIWLLLLANFFLPGLHQQERRLIIPFILTSLAFILLGCLFAYFATLPIANHYLAAFNQTIGMNFWSLENYLNYTLFLLMANGLAFELAAIGLFAVHMKVLSIENLQAYRRFAILGAFVMAALLTPPDVLTQCMLAIPLIGLYEIVILYARIRTV